MSERLNWTPSNLFAFGRHGGGSGSRGGGKWRLHPSSKHNPFVVGGGDGPTPGALCPGSQRRFEPVSVGGDESECLFERGPIRNGTLGTRAPEQNLKL